MTIRFVEDIYADFLFDCYIANQRLTDEDWFYYGREEHHIEVPTRDGGILTPLNSQSLTTYQHWIAGVLQSEMLNKKCYACVPSGVLPPMFETLRKKWDKLARTGKVASKVTREKMSDKKKGRSMPTEVREKIRATALSKREDFIRVQTPEMLEANRLARLGKVWFHDPIEKTERYFYPGQQPSTWIKGRLPR
jgi:hypothetical protein